VLDLVPHKVAELDRSLADLTEVRHGLRNFSDHPHGPPVAARLPSASISSDFRS